MLKILPKHLAVIPDGNRRWAANHRLTISAGYERGLKNFEEIVRAAFNRGVSYVTIWAASEDNLKKRSGAEVKFLVMLFKRALRDMIRLGEFKKNGIRVKILGQGAALVSDPALTKLITGVEEETLAGEKGQLTILFGYDGKQEMLAAMNQLISGGDVVDAASLERALPTGSFPAVDLVIRTGGEPHWSAGFMMWQTADSQFYFSEKFWPDFNSAELDLALADYANRGRRKGK